jgi:hypothetical protein
MKILSFTSLLTLFVLAIFIREPIAAQSGQFSLTPVVETGDPAPAGVTFAGLTNVAMNDAGQVALIAGDQTALYVLAGGLLTPLAVSDQEVPGMSGVFFDEITSVAINNRGDVAFVASVLGSRTGPVLFLYSNGTWRALVFSGDRVPSPLVFASFQDFSNVILNETGGVVFTGRFRSTETGVFLFSAGVVQAIAVPTQDAPGTGGKFRTAAARSLTDDGTILFQGDIREGSVRAGIFLYRAGAIESVLLTGQPVPGRGGETFIRFTRATLIDQSGTVAFEGTGSLFSSGVFTISGSAVQPVIMSGDSLPGAGSKHVVDVLSLAGNLRGEFVFNVMVEQQQVALLRYANRRITSALISDQSVNGSFARRFIPSGAVVLNNSSAVAFVGGTLMPATVGVYLLSGTMRTALVTSQTAVPQSRLRLSTDIALNNQGAVAFTSVAAGNGKGLYLAQAETIRPMMLVGQAIPGTESLISDLTDLIADRLAMTEQQQIAKVAGTTTTGSEQGIFRASTGPLQSVALIGGGVPGMTSTLFKSFGEGVINNQGAVTFTSIIGPASGTDREVILQQRGQTMMVIASGDQSAPNTGGARLASFSGKDVWANEVGDVAFIADLNDGRQGLFLSSNRQIMLIALSGQPAQGVAGRTFEGFASVMVNGQKAVVFSASLSEGTGLFLFANSQIIPVAYSGQVVPGSDRTFRAFGAPAINDSGSVAFVGRYGSASQGVFVFSGGALTQTAMTAQPVPELQGRRFTAFFGLATNNRGEIAFVAALNGSPVPSVIVRMTPMQ